MGYYHIQSAPGSFGKSNKNPSPGSPVSVCAGDIYTEAVRNWKFIKSLRKRRWERENSASWNEANSGWSSLYISCESNLFCGVCVSKFAFRITFFPQRRWAGGIKRCCRYKHVPYKRKRRLAVGVCVCEWVTCALFFAITIIINTVARKNTQPPWNSAIFPHARALPASKTKRRSF